jgi:hypothetical protein
MMKSRRMIRAWHIAQMGERIRAHSVLVGRLERKRLLERPRRRWEDNTKMNLSDVGWGYGLDSFGLG